MRVLVSLRCPVFLEKASHGIRIVESTVGSVEYNSTVYPKISCLWEW